MALLHVVLLLPTLKVNLLVFHLVTHNTETAALCGHLNRICVCYKAERVLWFIQNRNNLRPRDKTYVNAAIFTVCWCLKTLSIQGTRLIWSGCLHVCIFSVIYFNFNPFCRLVKAWWDQSTNLVMSFQPIVSKVWCIVHRCFKGQLFNRDSSFFYCK